MSLKDVYRMNESSLKPGERLVDVGGRYGTVEVVGDGTVWIRWDDGTGQTANPHSIEHGKNYRGIRRAPDAPPGPRRADVDDRLDSERDVEDL